jgi:hypothetical protein
LLLFVTVGLVAVDDVTFCTCPAVGNEEEEGEGEEDKVMLAFIHGCKAQ